MAGGNGQKKVLLLSCNTGEGHNAAARAVIAQLEALGAQGVLMDALSFAPPGVSQLVGGVHRSVYRSMPALFGAGYAHTEQRAGRGASAPYRLSALYAPKLFRCIRQGGFDAVAAPHVFPAVALTWLRRQSAYAGAMRALPCCFIDTDYTCSPFVDETALDGYCIPHASLADEFAKKGIPAEKLLPTGIPVQPDFAARTPRHAARAALSLPQQGRVLLLMSGSMGAGGAEQTAAALVPRLGPRDRLICLCGNNRSLLRALRCAHGCDPRVLVLPYTDRVGLLMDAADLLLTKPGGLTVTEAAAKGLPLVLTDAVGGCEARNAAFFAGQGMAAVAHDSADAARRAARGRGGAHRPRAPCRHRCAARRLTARPPPSRFSPRRGAPAHSGARLSPSRAACRWGDARSRAPALAGALLSLSAFASAPSAAPLTHTPGSGR